MANKIIPSADPTYPGGTKTLSPVYINGVEMSALARSVSPVTNSFPAVDGAGEFWSTPQRALNDPNKEVLELTLQAPKSINRLYFEVPRFPHEMRVIYRESTAAGSRWQPFYLPNSNQAGWGDDVSDSLPSVILPFTNVSTGHPQHYGTGHWLPREYNLNTPITVQQIRITFVRKKTGIGPKDRAGKPVNYSLGVRNLVLSKRITNRGDIDNTPRSDDVLGERRPFATTVDLLGSPISLSVRENRANDLLSGGVWRCAPQPIQQAVVNLYADTRNGAGEAQVIDRFYMEPLTSGASVTLYYSNDEPAQGSAPGEDGPLPFPLTSLIGGGYQDGYGITLPTTEIAYVNIDNTGIQLDQYRPFWVGLVLTPLFPFDVGTTTVETTLLDSGSFRIFFDQNGLNVAFGGVIITDSDLNFSAHTRISVMAGFDGQRLSLYTDSGEVTSYPPFGEDVSTAPPLVPSVITADQLVDGADPNIIFRVGADLNDNPSPAGFRLEGLVFKTEPFPSDPSVLNRFVTDAPIFIAGGVPGDGDLSVNSVIRYLPAYQTGPDGLNPNGFIGGPLNYYEEMVWTCINQDFAVAKGFLNFNPVKAKFFKFEFTNLTPALYDDYEPISKSVKLLPNSAQPISTANKSTSTTNSQKSTASISVDVTAATRFFSDQYWLYTNNSPLQPPDSYQPTTGVHTTDPSLAERMRTTSTTYYNLQAWQTTGNPGRFRSVSRHKYQIIEVTQSQRVAYGVGLSGLRMYRLNYEAASDTGKYLEPFLDSTHLQIGPSGDSEGWTVDSVNGGLVGPSDLVVPNVGSITSTTFASQRKVIALQFATQQTPPEQLLPDPDVVDPNLSFWAPVGDARIEPATQMLIDFGNTMRVSRGVVGGYWSAVENIYPNWDSFAARNVTWDDLSNSGSTSASFGGVESLDTHVVTPKGRIYAAARVYTEQPLTAPLSLQILDENDNILAQETMSVGAGQMAEWYVPFTLADWTSVGIATWDQVANTYPTWNAAQAGGEWNDVANNQIQFTGNVSVRLVQQEPTSDVWYVDNISLFEDSLIWAFSRDGGKHWYEAYDVRNNPDGAMTFPADWNDPQDGLSLMWKVTATRANQRVDYLAIRPLYDTLQAGQPVRETIQVGGPNKTSVDYYQDVHDDPLWKSWDKPIPRDWWYSFRQWIATQNVEETSGAPLVISDFVVGLDEGAPEKGYVATEQTILQSTRTPQYIDPDGNVLPLPDSDQNSVQAFYPQGAPAVLALPDGTFFVATAMRQNVSDGQPTTVGGFIRMFRLDASLQVIGSTDYISPNVLNSKSGSPQMIALKLDGNKVALVMSDEYDSTLTLTYGGVGGAGSVPFSGHYFRDGAGHFVTGSTDSTSNFYWFGASPYLDQPNPLDAPGSSGAQIGINTTGWASAKIQASPSGMALPTDKHVSNFQVSALISPSSQGLATGAQIWIENAPDNPTALSLVLSTNTSAGPNPQWIVLAGGTQNAADLAAITGALTTGDLMVSVDPGGTNNTTTSRRVSTVTVTVTYDRGNS